MKLSLEDHAYHRNGICGAPFDVLLFRDAAEGPMLGIVFAEPYHVAVLNLDRLAQRQIAMGVNSWRGDQYEPALRRIINHQQQED